ncbi:MAG: PilZ domain-containing protein [Planctomycetes bacterium]|nr:PilZ domain-containing protein [Planctomycetota bacterium]
MREDDSDPEHELRRLEVEDRRRHPRIPSTARVAMRLDSDELAGVAENLSAGGVLFFSPGELRMTLVIDEGGKRVERVGRLVRAQRMRGGKVGWAVEFDPS